MKYFQYVALVLIVLSSCQKSTLKPEEFQTQFEKSDGAETATYAELVDFYKRLDLASENIRLTPIGQTDSGKPLHLVQFNAQGNFEASKEQYKLLINNGIHPGESDGIDATMMLFRDLASEKIKLDNPKLLISAIVVYNVGGALNRNSTTRANQNGPVSYGFRGNARNFDLNRDFIKADTENARSFAQVYHSIKPDLFIDNHVSNGADYQYVITHLFTQHNKLAGPLGAFLDQTWQPYLEQAMADDKYPITPYVNVFGRTPDPKGFSQFMDYPRYSTGYTSLFNTLGMMVETHMLKPYKDRVLSTYILLENNLDFLNLYGKQIKELRKKQDSYYRNIDLYPLKYSIDYGSKVSLDFLGYEGTTEKSEVTTGSRLKYHHDKPFEKKVDYFNQMIASSFVEVPEYFVVPKGFWPVINRLKENKIKFKRLAKDSIIEVRVKHISKFETRTNAYEGHYPHYNTNTMSSIDNIQFYKGDYLIPLNQEGMRYLMETLEPEAIDSFFNWNYFDTILQQKEGFSSYVFEDYALEFLNDHPKIKSEFNQKLKSDSDFASKPYVQLRWIFTHSNLYEKAHMRYPIFAILKN